ncbi:uncharacterized protein LOC124942368 [Impatiens glandulifera]|uniref:uncharacterized protein LOC124942368 n=1 Tax=Impatiens glandulifera TaxID=253017 RepID=UPI001FB17D19|nr:uncharacterized protein LOC124942368 [Impatiens glandulifera]
MEFINAELKCAEEASHQLAGKCNCSIKTIYGLPCKHDLAHYRFLSIPIPIQSINAHWRRLSMNGHEYHDDGARANRTSKIDFNIADPSQSTVRAPSYNTEHRGRPTGKDEQSKRRIPFFVDISTSSSRATQTNATSRKRGRGRGSGVRNTLSTHDHPPVSPFRDTYIEKLPTVMQPYISHIVDVEPDGHCGFRAIAALIGYGEEGWIQVRYDLMEEIQQNKRQYDQLYPDREMADNLLVLLKYFEQPAPERSPPVPDLERREIAIALVGQHFVQVFLHPHYPVPPFPMWWCNHSSDEAKGWATSYITRANLWYEITGTGPNGGAEFGGNID